MSKSEQKYDVTLNKITLIFLDEKFEKKFRVNYFRKSLITLRISLITSIVLYAGFGLLDKFSSPSFSKEFFVIRFFIVIPILLGIAGITFLRNFFKYWQPLISMALILAGSGIIFMLHRHPGNLYYYGGMFLIFMGGYFFLKLRFFIATLSGLLLVLIYNAAYFALSATSVSSIDNIILANAFFVASNIICMIGLYSIEKLERIDFYRKKLLTDKQAEIESINTELENKVNSRTKALKLAKEKAEESDRLKTAFLANMSHEIRTPMNGILGFSELLKDPRLTGEKQQNFISIIEKSGNRMLNTVNDIIEVSKIEAGHMDLVESNVDIVHEMNALYDFFKPETDSKGLKLFLTINLTQDEHIVFTDQSKFNSILTNLIKNAIKYTDEGYVEIVCKRKKNILEYAIHDSGIGIPSDRMSAIFNRFEQADITDKHARQGSGLGLAICKSYVEMLGGEIWVQSECNVNELNQKNGSVFYFSIPFIQKNNEITAKDHTVENIVKFGKTRKTNILIVEDDATSVEYLKILLNDITNQLAVAVTGTEAVEQVRRNEHFDMVLMDMKMPGMDGFAATKLIKEIMPDLPIIATTAYAYHKDRIKAENAGCDGFITKPINKNDLFAVIEKFLVKC